MARLSVPPLRERPEDIVLLAEHFLHEVARGRLLTFSAEDLRRLEGHLWPGNVRELRNAVEGACVFASENRLYLEEFLSSKQATPETQTAVNLPLKEARQRAVATFEQEYVRKLLRACGRSVTAAARQAEVDRRYLHELIRKHEIKDEPSEGGSL